MAALLALLDTSDPLAAAGVAGAVLLAFWIYLNKCISRQRARFENQLADAMQLIARSLRAGHPVLGSFQLVANELEPPTSTMFASVCQQQAMGKNLETALREAADASTSEDARLFAASIAVAMRSGGDLADMMDRMSAVITDRIRLGRHARVLTAQVQLNKQVLLALPFFLFILLYLMRPGYLRPLLDTSIGNIMLAGGIASMLTGAWIMNRMARIRY